MYPVPNSNIPIISLTFVVSLNKMSFCIHQGKTLPDQANEAMEEEFKKLGFLDPQSSEFKLVWNVG